MGSLLQIVLSPAERGAATGAQAQSGFCTNTLALHPFNETAAIVLVNESEGIPMRLSAFAEDPSWMVNLTDQVLKSAAQDAEILLITGGLFTVTLAVAILEQPLALNTVTE